MKKLLKLGVLLLVIAAILSPSLGQAFNSATHIYIAERVFPFALDKINLYYGSIAPDLSMYVNQPQNWPDAFMETHYSITLPYAWWNPTQRAFAKGWQTHNEKWGADFYAHGTYPNYYGYVITQAITLATIPGFEMYLYTPPYFEMAHFAIEVAIDLLLLEDHDPSLGLKLFLAAKYRSSQDLNLMAKAFVWDNEPNLPTLSGAESTFRDLVINYATALMLPAPFRMTALGDLGYEISQGTIPPTKVQEILGVAMDLCQDTNYYKIIESAIKGISKNPDLIR